MSVSVSVSVHGRSLAEALRESVRFSDEGRQRRLLRARLWRAEVFRQRVVLWERQWENFRVKWTRGCPPWVRIGWGTKTLPDQKRTVAKYVGSLRATAAAAFVEDRANRLGGGSVFVGPNRTSLRPPRRLPEFTPVFPTAHERRTHPLATLRARYCNKLTDVGLLAVLPAAPNLVSLDVTGTGATDAVVDCLVTACTRLQSLLMKECTYGLPGGAHLRVDDTATEAVKARFKYGVSEDAVRRLADSLRFTR